MFSSLQELNETIDNLHDEVAFLSLHHAQPETIVKLHQLIHAFQQQAGNLIQQETNRKLAPLAAGLDILDHADEIRAKYGIK